MGVNNPCFTGDNYIVNRQLLSAQLQKGNIMYFSRLVHVQLGDIDVHTSTVQLSTYGIYLVEADINTYVCPVPITPDWLKKLQFEPGERGQYSIPMPERPVPASLILKLHPSPSRGWLTKLVTHTGGWILPYQQHLHQLQNLYAALAPGHFLTLKK
jgi:hypothetical protein